MTWQATGHHTGELFGMKPIHKHKMEFPGLIRATVGGSGKISKVQLMHGNLMHEAMGHLNHLMVDTQELTKNMIGFWNREHDDLSIYTPDVKFIDDINLKGMSPDATVVGPQAILDMRNGYANAFPDLKLTDMYASPLQGDSFITTFNAEGTHNGELMGHQATGKRIDNLVAIINRVVAGKIFEQRAINSKHLLHELGLLPDKSKLKAAMAKDLPEMDTRGLASACTAMWNGIGDGSNIFAKNVEWIDEVNMPHKPIKGLQKVRDMIAGYRKGFADLHFTQPTVVSPLRKDWTFLLTWHATGTHTGDLMGMAPLHNHKMEFHGLVRCTVDSSGMISKVLGMVGSLMLEQTGYLNHLMVDTDRMAQQWASFWNQENDDMSMYTPDVKVIDHVNLQGVAPDATVVGHKGMLDLRNQYVVAFPDLHATKFEATPLQGDTFVITWTVEGTHKGDLLGFPASGKRLTDHDGACINKVVAGKISEQRVVHSKHVLRELGLLPEKPKRKVMDQEIEL